MPPDGAMDCAVRASMEVRLRVARFAREGHIVKIITKFAKNTARDLKSIMTRFSMLEPGID